jgi:hypothetical protein
VAVVDRALDDGPPARELRLGFDNQARLLETVVLIFEKGNIRFKSPSDTQPVPRE